MEFNVIEEKKDSLVFELKGEAHTFPHLLCWALLKDKKVEVAVYEVKHPLVGNPVIHLRTKNKNPRKALQDALKVIKKEVASGLKAITKK